MQATEKLRAPRGRRHHDSGAPDGCADRRCGRERRRPLAQELSLSDSEWKTYFSTPVNPSEKSDYETRQALDVLGRMLSPHGPLGKSAANFPRVPESP